MTKEEKIAALDSKVEAFKADLIASLELPTTENPGSPPNYSGIQQIHSAFNDLTRMEIRIKTYLESLPA